MVGNHLLSEQVERQDTTLTITLDLNLRSPERRLIEMKIEHADLDAMVDLTVQDFPIDELMLRRLKKRRLSLRDQISRLELSLQPPQPA
ncbi:MAG: hypothetical protein JWQ72_1905 [Polaromonas sp.]|nr:hypothetical protein [Polaromonas sp.]